MFTDELIKLLEKLEFISVATCDFEGRPNAVPKFLLKVDKDYVYMVDYTIGTTWKNLKINPRVSISFMDHTTLKGYQLNGKAEIITKGREYNKLCKEMLAKEIRLTTQHIIEDVRGESMHETFELVITEKFVVLKIKIDEIVDIGVKGELNRQK